MHIESFNSGWMYKSDVMSGFVPVTLPHDAQLSAKREKNSPGGSAHGYFTGGVYTYEKEFEAPLEWSGKHIEILFEGAYKNAEVFLNGEKISEHKYGYTAFSAVLDDRLKYGEVNTLKVVCDNSKLPNSRWYTGGGLYRPVWILSGGKSYIKRSGIRIDTISLSPVQIHISTDCAGLSDNARIEVSILDGEKEIASEFGAEIDLTLDGAVAWSEDNPKLYTLVARIVDGGITVDETRETFGIRTIEYSTKGLFINGKNTLLRGGCIHHDNGVIGACEFRESADRRIRILKENGFNAVRISHNPASSAILDACDKYGMYVMDESFDMWYNRKNPYDYGMDFEKCWREDLDAMVTNDYNHPSVIMYSIGNEVAEPASDKGLKVGQDMIDFLHKIDKSRPVTCGVNLMVMSRASKGNAIYQDGQQNTGSEGNKTADDVIQEAKNGSLLFNIMASFIGSSMNNSGNSKKVDNLTSAFCDKLDMVGYNYGSGRYPLDEKSHPDRIILGSETFPQDIYKNWQMVKKYPYLLGDFMWTAWDYIGEAGLGAWSYTGGMAFNRPYPWLLAGSGVIDIIGTPDMSCKYASVVWGKEDKPVIGVKPVNHPGIRPSKSSWRGTNAICSWAFNGCEGNSAEVEVYSDQFQVELFLNEKSLGKRNIKDCKAIFKLKYTPGTLKAVAYDKAGEKVSENIISSATGEIRLHARSERTDNRVGDVVYVNVSLEGENGVVESNDDRKLECKVSGCELLGFGSGNPCTTESFTEGKYTTYYGRALAVVRITGENPCIEITDGKETVKEEL